MNYSRHYAALIGKAQNREPIGYIERHHIIPKCIGGLNTKGNIVKLYPEEHYVAHQLLVKMYPGNHKLVYSTNMMTVDQGNGDRVNNKKYKWLKLKFADSISGVNSPLFGTKT